MDEPAHDVISAPFCVGVRTSVHSVGDAPVFWLIAVITPVATVVPPETYCVVVVEQPAEVSSAGSVPPWVDVYSATDVLHAAMAASASDIFERIT